MATSKDLVESMKIIANSVVSNAPFDRTYVGKIVSINSDGTYDVEVNRKVYTLNVYIKRTLALNETVKVTFPLGNVSNAFIL